LIAGIDLTRPEAAHADEVLTPEALGFVAQLHRSFKADRLKLLADRARRQARLDAGEMPDFMPNPIESRDGSWGVAPARGAMCTAP
jgi:malate synthase